MEESMATRSSILAWRIPMDTGAWRAIAHRVIGSQAGHDWSDSARTQMAATEGTPGLGVWVDGHRARAPGAWKPEWEGGGWGPGPGELHHLFLPASPPSARTGTSHLLSTCCIEGEGHTAVDRRGLCPYGSDAPATPETHPCRLQCQAGRDALKKSQTKERWRATSGWVGAILGQKEELSAKARLTKTSIKWEVQTLGRQNIFYLFLFWR